MGQIANTPVNKNPLIKNGFQLFIKRAPHVNFFIQKVKIPNIVLGTFESPNPFYQTPVPGEHMKYEDLIISFQVDEELKNYLEVHDWIKALGKPDTFDQYKTLHDQSSLGEGIYSDVSLLVNNSKRNINFDVTFKDAFPFSLSELEFDSTITETEYQYAIAVFKYTTYEITKL
jgi:hypothetical protein